MVAAKKSNPVLGVCPRIGSIKEHRIGLLDRRAADLPGVVAPRSDRSLLPFNHSRGDSTLCVTHTRAHAARALLQSSKTKIVQTRAIAKSTNEDASQNASKAASFSTWFLTASPFPRRRR
jgi:hypothetical protein